MKILLVAINAKYIHSNLAVYSLRAFAKKKGHEVALAEYTINQKVDLVLQEIYKQKPDVLVLSCYIWNIDFVLEVSREFHKLRPEVPIWCGGPEVSFEVEAFLGRERHITGVMMGEGEATFSSLCEVYEAAATAQDLSIACLADRLRDIDGIAYRNGENIVEQPLRQLLSMDELPFCYEDPDVFEHRIIYYESSRGCPFRCSYCLSSVDKRLRFRSLDLVLPELQVFLDHKVPQVKFVDRTFNCDHKHAMAIWRYIHEHDNGVTNFHFEVSADLLTEEEIELIGSMRTGLIQLEIGVQSTHPETIREIHRTMDLTKVHVAVSKVQQGANIHQHLDLIAGLPKEDYATFRHSFDEIYAWKPDQLQLGFLKVLKGSYMFEHAEEYGICYRYKAPYEVLSTKWLSYEEILQIKVVEEMLEIHYNSGQFRAALLVLEQNFDSAFQMYLELGRYYEEHGYLEGNQTRVKRADILLEFAMTVDPGRGYLYQEALLFDLYKLEKSKKRPDWALDQAPYKSMLSAYLREHGIEKKYCHTERFQWLDFSGGCMKLRSEMQEQWVLFDYDHRSPLTNEATLTVMQGLDR